MNNDPITDSRYNQLLHNWFDADPGEDCFLYDSLIIDLAAREVKQVTEAMDSEEEKVVKEHISSCPYCYHVYLDTLQDMQAPLSDAEKRVVNQTAFLASRDKLTTLIERYAQKSGVSVHALITDTKKLLESIFFDENRIFDISSPVTFAGCSSEEEFSPIEPDCIKPPMENAGVGLFSEKEIFFIGSFSANHSGFTIILHTPSTELAESKNLVRWAGDFDSTHSVYVVSKHFVKNKKSMRIKIGDVLQKGYPLGKLLDLEKLRFLLLPLPEDD